MEEKFGMLALDSDNNFGVHFHPITSELTCFSLRTLRVLARLSLSSETTSKLNTQPVIFRDSQSSKPCVVLCLTPNLVRYFSLPSLKVLRDLTLQDIKGDSKVLCMRIDNFVSKDEELAFFMVDEKQKLRYVSPSNTIEFESRLSKDLLFDFNANTLCALAEDNCVHFFDLDLEDNVAKLGFGPRHRLPNDKPIVLLRCHPELNEVVALADSIGRILLCRLGSNNRVFHSVLHWHSSPVSALAFSSDGADLVSGGNEAVLVKWNVEQGKPHVFAPRLGAKVVDVQVQTKSNHCYALLKDDALVKLNEAFFVSGRNFVGSHLRTAQKAKLWWHVATSTLAFVNASGFVHFFSPNTHETAFILEIDDTNAIRGGVVGRKQGTKNDDSKDKGKDDNIKKEDNDLLVSPVMALGEERGDWLVSVADKDIRLWHLAPDKECKFIMHSCIIQPHTQPITMLRLIEHYKDPTQCLLISSSLDKSIKIWQYTEDLSWQFLTTLTFRNKVASSLDYSRDRSLLAIGYEEVVALFSLNKFTLKSTLAKSDFSENIESLAFNREKQHQHQLITTTKNKVMIWDVLRSQLMMTIDSSGYMINPVGPDLVLIADCKSGQVRSIKQVMENKNEFVVHVGNVDESDENWLSLISDLDNNVFWSRGQHVEWGGRLDLAPVEESEEERKPNKLFTNLTYIDNLQDQTRLQHLRDIRLRDIKITRPLMASLDRVLEQVL